MNMSFWFYFIKSIISKALFYLLDKFLGRSFYNPITIISLLVAFHYKIQLYQFLVLWLVFLNSISSTCKKKFLKFLLNKPIQNLIFRLFVYIPFISKRCICYYTSLFIHFFDWYLKFVFIFFTLALRNSPCTFVFIFPKRITEMYYEILIRFYCIYT
jgi:hypothetical protein